MKINSLYYGDCLDWMRQWPADSVDLVYLDPPFNSRTDYNILFGQGQETQAQVRAFKDTWTWDHAAQERLDDMEGAVAHPAHNAARGLHIVMGKTGMLAYLTYMAQRLAECHRLLKDSGSLYLHCDDSASHYLKVLTDGIFGGRYFRNEVTWRRATAHNDAKRYGRISDKILFYTKGDAPYWAGHNIASPKTKEQLLAAYPREDEIGKYRADNLTGPRHGGGPHLPSAKPWRGYDVHARNRHWSPPKTGHYAEFIDSHFVRNYLQIEGVHERLDALDEAGLIHHPKKKGAWPGLKRYAMADQDIVPQDIFLQPRGFTNFSKGKEWLGYPTQKPMELLRKLILASSPKGGLVLDPFCGCGTTMDAAARHGRNWIGIDISTFAINLIRYRRLKDRNIPTFGIPQDLAGARQLAKDRPLDFEAWAVNLLPGFAPNLKKVGDTGIDGRAAMLHKPAGEESALILAQVKSGKFQLGQLRDFLHVVKREKAAMGIYITLTPITGATARKELAALGSIRIGAQTYPRAQGWSVAEYFEKTRPPLPPMRDPFTGKPMQEDLYAHAP